MHTDLDRIRREVFDAARAGDPGCAEAALKEALHALDGTDDLALDYLRECLGRMLSGIDIRRAFNLDKRKPGRPVGRLKSHRDALLRWEVHQLVNSGTTVEEAVHRVAEEHDVSVETVRTARWPR